MIIIKDTIHESFNDCVMDIILIALLVHVEQTDLQSPFCDTMVRLEHLIENCPSVCTAFSDKHWF